MAQELMDWGRQLPGSNAKMVKLLRLRVDNGEEEILSIHYTFPDSVVPNVDMIRSCLMQEPEQKDVYINHDIDAQPADLSRFDEKCGVV